MIELNQKQQYSLGCLLIVLAIPCILLGRNEEWGWLVGCAALAIGLTCALKIIKNGR